MVCGMILESVGFEGNIGSEQSRRRGFGLKEKKGEKKNKNKEMVSEQRTIMRG